MKMLKVPFAYVESLGSSLVGKKIHRLFVFIRKKMVWLFAKCSFDFNGSSPLLWQIWLKQVMLAS